MSTRVLLVDDHAATREPLALLLGRELDLVVAAEAATCAEARARALDSDAEVAVVDLGLPDGDGVALIRELRTVRPGLAVLRADRQW